MNLNDNLECALDIQSAQADHIRVDPVRRLTGPGLLWERSGAVVDVHIKGETKHLLLLWQSLHRKTNCIPPSLPFKQSGTTAPLTF